MSWRCMHCARKRLSPPTVAAFFVSPPSVGPRTDCSTEQRCFCVLFLDARSPLRLVGWVSAAVNGNLPQVRSTNRVAKVEARESNRKKSEQAKLRLGTEKSLLLLCFIWLEPSFPRTPLLGMGNRPKLPAFLLVHEATCFSLRVSQVLQITKYRSIPGPTAAA